MIAVVYVAHVRFALNAVLAFWVAYILTRPLGASIGDYLSQPRRRRRPRPRHDGDERRLPAARSSAVVVFLTLTKRDVIEAEPAVAGVERSPAVRGFSSSRTRRPRRRRWSRPCASAPQPARPSSSCSFPNPAHLAFDRISRRHPRGRAAPRARRCPSLEQAAGTQVEGRVATSPNAFDDIVAELERRSYSEIILETLPSHVSHWLHVDLAQRLAHLGYPLTTVTATSWRGT